MNCFTKNISKIIPDSPVAAKIAYGRTKASTVTKDVLGSFLQEKIISDLKDSHYFTICSDTSNVGIIKTFPFAVQYFHEKSGICQKLLDFYEDPMKHLKIYLNISNKLLLMLAWI